MKSCIKKNVWALIAVALIVGIVSCANAPNGPNDSNGTEDSTSKHEHTFGEYVSNNDATTLADGTKTRKCKVCGFEETVTDEGSKLLAHTWDEGRITKSSTTTEFGEKTFTCTDPDCGETKIQYLPTLADANGFVKVKGVTITGTETWSPVSKVFVSGRRITIPTLIVSDHEVTKGEYKAIMKNDPATYTIYDKDDNDLSGDDALNGAVSNVNWYDALVYCNERSKAENLTPCYSINGSTDTSTWGDAPASKNEIWDAAVCNFEANGYRLPTEAEWEWLARGEENYTYAGSNDLSEIAWINPTNNRKGIRVVKSKKPNGYGLYDMNGNVWEWCWDWYCSDPTASTPASGETSGDARNHRGSAVDGQASNCVLTYHDGDNPAERGYSYGFRVVRTAQ